MDNVFKDEDPVVQPSSSNKDIDHSTVSRHTVLHVHVLFVIKVMHSLGV